MGGTLRSFLVQVDMLCEIGNAGGLGKLIKPDLFESQAIGISSVKRTGSVHEGDVYAA